MDTKRSDEMKKQVQVVNALAAREQLLSVRLLFSGYMPLTFVLGQAIHLLAPLAMLLGIPLDKFPQDPWLGILPAEDPPEKKQEKDRA